MPPSFLCLLYLSLCASLFPLKPSEPQTRPSGLKPLAEKKLWLNVTDLEDADIEELMETLTFYEGETAVVFVKDGKKMLCSQKVNAGKALMAELLSFLSENQIKLM